MSQPAGYYVDPAALAAYGSAVPGLAAQLGETGSTTLSGTTALAADCFGQVGQEVGLTAALKPQQDLTLRVTRTDGRVSMVPVRCRIDTPIEIDYYQHGGILPYVLRQIVARN